MTRAEHLEWCKVRAMRYVEVSDFKNAVTSMLSDLSKHEDTKASSRGIVAQIGLFELMNSPTKEKITASIRGFN